MRPSLHTDGARPEREGVVCYAFIYIDATRDGALHDAKRGFSRRGTGRMGSVRPFSAPIPRQIDIQWRDGTTSKLLC